MTSRACASHKVESVALEDRNRAPHPEFEGQATALESFFTIFNECSLNDVEVQASGPLSPPERSTRFMHNPCLVVLPENSSQATRVPN